MCRSCKQVRLGAGVFYSDYQDSNGLHNELNIMPNLIHFSFLTTQKLLLWLCMIVTVCASIVVVQANSLYTSATRIGKHDGLPETTIFSLAADKQGFMWLGAPNSLSRYDGHEFIQFSKASNKGFKLHVGGAGSLLVDSQNRLWIGAWGDGLAVYDQSMNLLHHFRHNPNDGKSLPGDKVQVIFEDDAGDIWIGTNGGGLAVFEPQTQDFVRYLHNPSNSRSLSHNRVWSIAQNAAKQLWIGTSNGLNRLNLDVTNRSNATFERFNNDSGHGLNHSLVRSLYADKKGNLWLGTQGDFGLWDTNNHQFTPIALPNDMGGTIVNRIKEDNQGNIFVATQNGLYHYLTDKQALSPWSANEGVQLFAERDIRDVMVDSSGLLWLTTRFAGLIKIDLSSSSIQPFASFVTDGNDYPLNRVYAALADSNNRLWLSGSTGLFYKDVDDNVFRRYELPQPIEGKNITALAIKDNKLWLGGHFGLYSLNWQTNQITAQNQILDSLETKSIHSLLTDSNNNLWIGTTHQGLVKLSHSGEREHYFHQRHQAQSISGNTIVALFEDNHGHIWIGTASSGLNRLDVNSQKFVRYQASANENSLSSNVINDIYQTKKGDIWVATSQSINKLDLLSGKFTQYGIKSGLGVNNIMAIIEDNNHTLWVSDSNGIARWQSEEGRFNYFNRRSFIGDNQFLPGVAAKSHDGKIYFGGTSGVSQVQPNLVHESQYVPQVAITNISIDDNILAYSAIPRETALEVQYNHKHLQIQFAALDFHQTSKNHYRYMLKGFDDTWRKSTKIRQVSFTALPAGSYELKVLASANGRKWGDNPLVLPIVVLPPWWQMWWFKLIIALICLAIAWYYYQFRQRQIELNAAKLEQQINMRTSQLDESNKALASTIHRLNESQSELVEQQKMASLGQMVAGIAHEVNTPLGLGITASTVLKQRIEELKKLFYDKKLKPMHLNKFLEEGSQNADIIFGNLEKAANLVHGFKQVAVDQSSEDDRSFNVTEMLEEIMVTLSPTMKECDHILTYRCDPQLTIHSKPGPLSQILFNLINNSLSHAFDGIEDGLMTIDVSCQSGHVILIYRDNGCGLDESSQKQIYEPFVTTKRGEGKTGLGMHLVYNLVCRGLSGSIKLKSALMSGVEYRIVFPADSREQGKKVSASSQSQSEQSDAEPKIEIKTEAKAENKKPQTPETCD